MKYVEKYDKQVRDFLAVCRLLGKRVYVTSHGGNLSYRLEEDLLLITPTRVYKGNLKADDLVFIDLAGNIIEGSLKPSGETPMYLNFFKDRPDINSVIHCHPPVTNAFAITKGRNWLMRPIFPETVVEVGPVPVVPYGEPLTQRLADNFKPYLQKYNAFLMESHGLVIMSPGDIVRAFELTDILETSAVSILQALAVGEIKEISKDDVKNLENTMKTRHLPMIGNPALKNDLLGLYFSKSS
ncbi:MAG: class II aldolase/adducin family protein [Desulfobacterales bacterium]|jgi:L-fuculose-phosphate aldolase